MKLHFQDSGSIKSLLSEALLCTVSTEQHDNHSPPCSLILCSDSMKLLLETAALDLFSSSEMNKNVEPNRVVIKYFTSGATKGIKTQTTPIVHETPLSRSPQDALLELDDSASKFSFLGVIGIEETKTVLINDRGQASTLKKGKTEVHVNDEAAINEITVDLQMLSSLLCLIAHAPTNHLLKNFHLCFPLIDKRQAAMMPRLLALLTVHTL